jgi:hypothetical protein
MTGWSRRSGLAFTASAALVALVGVVLVYAGSFDTGLYYDDYHFVRPPRPLEFRRIWYGSWDPTGIETYFYRPLTALFFSLRFWLFGVNTQAMHAASLLGHGLCAVLLGWFLRREGVRSTPAVLGTWIYATHPLFPYAQASWLTNQMHLLESLLVITTFLTWQVVRDRSLQWWFPLLSIAVAAFLVKEDAIMLLPVIVVLTMFRGWLAGDVRWKRCLVLAATVLVVLAALLIFRYVRLGRVGGYAVPTFFQAQTNFWKGLDAALLLWPTRTPWQGLASVIAIASVAAALVVGRRGVTWVIVVGACAFAVLLAFGVPSLFLPIDYPRMTWQGIASGIAIGTAIIGLGVAIANHDRQAIFIIGAGLVIAFGFDLPFFLVSKREQFHLLALGAVLVFAGAVGSVDAAILVHRRLFAALALVLTLPLALLARGQAADFRPCAAATVEMDNAASHWWIVPREITAWVTQKDQNCLSGAPLSRLVDLPLISWGMNGDERAPGGDDYQWTSDHAVLLVRREAPALALALRRPDASRSAPVSIQIRGGVQPTTVVLDSPEWQYTTVRFSPGVLTTLRASHRVDLDVRPWYVPAVLDPKSPDVRRFGVQLRVISTRPLSNSGGMD